MAEDKPPKDAPPSDEKPSAGEPKRAPTWVTEDPFPPRAKEPAPSSKVAIDPSLQAELSRPTPPPGAPSPGGPSPGGPSPGSPTTATGPSSFDDRHGEGRAARRWLGLPLWGWVLALVAGLTVLFLGADLRNRNRFTIVCNARKVELQQGRRLPWPFGREAVGGPEYKPIAIPVEADCRRQVFDGEEEAARAFLEILLAQVRNALANPGASNLKEARQQLQQALLLTRTYRGRRKDAESMAADLSYREGRAGLARAENELRIALARFQEAQKHDARRFDDLDEWISHLEEMLRTIAPTPFSSPGAPRVGPGLSSRPPGPSTRPAGGAPALQPSPPPPQPGDAGPPSTGGGILM